MTVQQLIDKLKKLSPDLKVAYYNNEGDYEVITKVMLNDDKAGVTII